MQVEIKQPSYTALHLFCGLGGCARGFQDAGFETLLGIDSDAAACADFMRIVNAPALQADLSSMSPDELRAACGGRRPDVVVTSPPCKSHSGCLPKEMSLTPKYQAMSELSLRGVWIALEAWPVPPPLIILENVPRIQSRGAQWLDQLTKMLQAYGYAVRGTTHDCGEVGGLAQHRRRYLLVARHMEQVPALLYEPAKRRVRGCGEVLGELPVPLPNSRLGGPMHALCRMSALNWLRLALIPAGRDYRALPPSVMLPPREARQNGQYGVVDWHQGAHAVVGCSQPQVAWSSVSDPRVDLHLAQAPRSGAYGVTGADTPASTILAAGSPDNARCAFADPRVTARRREGALGVTHWQAPSTTVISRGIPQNGPWQVADPRLTHEPRHGSWGVVDWASPTYVIRAVEKYQNTASTVADPRLTDFALVSEHAQTDEPLDFAAGSKQSIHMIIRALDGTWHRPMTPLELAALQGLPVRDEAGQWLTLTGKSKKGWRTRIGNAVPPPAAKAIAQQMIKTLDAARNGHLLLSSSPIWVDRAEHVSLM